MISSMTGYAAVTREVAAGSIALELRSVNSRFLDVQFRIAEELRTLYSVGYVSSNARRDGKWRRIVVRVPDREGITVRHKLGYYAPRG